MDLKERRRELPPTHNLHNSFTIDLWCIVDLRHDFDLQFDSFKSFNVHGEFITRVEERLLDVHDPFQPRIEIGAKLVFGLLTSPFDVVQLLVVLHC